MDKYFKAEVIFETCLPGGPSIRIVQQFEDSGRYSRTELVCEEIHGYDSTGKPNWVPLQIVHEKMLIKEMAEKIVELKIVQKG